MLELRSAATLGQAKLHFMGVNNRRVGPTTHDPEEEKEKEEDRTYAFQASNEKLIETLYRKDVFDHFTTIFDGCIRPALPPLPQNLVDEVALYCLISRDRV